MGWVGSDPPQHSAQRHAGHKHAGHSDTVMLLLLPCSHAELSAAGAGAAAQDKDVGEVSRDTLHTLFVHVEPAFQSKKPACLCHQFSKQVNKQLRSAQAELRTATAQAAAAQADAAAMQQQLQEAAQQLADARQQLADAAESRDAMQQQLSSLQATLQDAASEKDAAFTRLGESTGGL